jgi:hypothetical protein
MNRFPRSTMEAFRNTTEHACAVTRPMPGLFGRLVEYFCWCMAAGLLLSIWFAPQLWEQFR